MSSLVEVVVVVEQIKALSERNKIRLSNSIISQVGSREGATVYSMDDTDMLNYVLFGKRPTEIIEATHHSHYNDEDSYFYVSESTGYIMTTDDIYDAVIPIETMAKILIKHPKLAATHGIIVPVEWKNN